jgi:predicted transposase/invertase (TIGR01784 family)
MAKPFYFARNDAMFKLIFGDNRDVEPLAAFLQAALDLPAEDLAEITIIDPAIAPDRPGGKLGILDVRARTATGKMIDIEIQLCDHAALRERIMFYLARMVSDQIGSGDQYREIKQSICILITDFVLVPENEVYYHNRYQLYN